MDNITNVVKSMAANIASQNTIISNLLDTAGRLINNKSTNNNQRTEETRKEKPGPRNPPPPSC